MSKWQELTLGDVLEVKYGKDHKHLEDGHVPLFGSGGVMRKVNKSLYAAESILIPRKGTLNNVIYCNEPFWTVDTMFYTVLNTSLIVPKFVFYQLSLIDFNNLNVGSAVPSLTVPVIKEISLSIPPLPEQQAIAEVLSSLDDKIDLLHRNNKILEEMAETLFRQWFVEGAKEDWDEMFLGDVFNIYRGLSYKGSGLTDKGDLNAVVMLNLNSVFEGGGFKDIGHKYYNGEYKERHKIYPGELLVTNTEQGHEHRLIGFGALVPKTITPFGIFSQHTYRVVPKKESLSSEFLYLLLKMPNIREQVIGGTNGSTVNMLPIESLSSVKFLLPDSRLLELFNRFASDVFYKIEINKSQIAVLSNQRDSLLPKLMSGQVRVNL